MIYSCIVLALYQDIQTKAREEVDAIYAQLSEADHGELSYSAHYPKFRYLVAFMVRCSSVRNRDSSLLSLVRSPTGLPHCSRYRTPCSIG